jgi:hypothetical protein
MSAAEEKLESYVGASSGPHRGLIGASTGPSGWHAATREEAPSRCTLVKYKNEATIAESRSNARALFSAGCGRRHLPPDVLRVFATPNTRARLGASACVCASGPRLANPDESLRRDRRARGSTAAPPATRVGGHDADDDDAFV